MHCVSVHEHDDHNATHRTKSVVCVSYGCNYDSARIANRLPQKWDIRFTRVEKIYTDEEKQYKEVSAITMKELAQNH